MSELKSAWEIAQEKASRLGKLSAEEEQQYREESYREIGTAIAQKFLDSFDDRSLASALGGYSETERDVIKKAALSRLAEATDLTSLKKLEEISRGMAGLEPRLQSALERIAEVANECEQARTKARRELEDKGKERLHRMRITGTAVSGINVEATEEWKESEQQLMAVFGPRFDSLKQELASAI